AAVRQVGGDGGDLGVHVKGEGPLEAVAGAARQVPGEVPAEDGLAQDALEGVALLVLPPPARRGPQLGARLEEVSGDEIRPRLQPEAGPLSHQLSFIRPAEKVLVDE